ncbi:hypothetical protein GQ600_24046 [Phytophthora cactorum]|nr:hypothetical protein GQ600_24046 [Phytophthora cactorum]
MTYSLTKSCTLWAFGDQDCMPHEDGAIARGTFSRFMTRDRFEEILRYLHLNDRKVRGHALTRPEDPSYYPDSREDV